MSALELLVIVSMVAAIVGLGVPTLHAKGESAVLDANMRSLSSLVQEEIVEGYLSAYQPSGVGTSDTHLSSQLERVLGEAVGGARYRNPYADRQQGADIVVNSSAIPAESSLTFPAVFITDNPQCAYEVFDGRDNELGHRSLRGSLVVEFNAQAARVEVFYVGKQGDRSPDVVTFPMG